MPATMLRLMGESDIIDIDPAAHDGGIHPRLMGLEAADRINLLGHWLDQDRGEALAEDPDHLSAMIAIGAGVLEERGPIDGWGETVNFVVLTLLREKWPVGSKARFQARADRVGADHTYLAHLCTPARIDDLSDETALKQSETSQLMMEIPRFRQARKSFANSSAVQTLIRQGL
ncbi:MAG: hypothetical protein ACON31_05610 [Candidatus Puniceispirillaceae bacterium]